MSGARLPTKAEWASFGRWAKGEAAEWLVGSWALIIGWFIVGVIFFNLLQMDGHFSRGLGEGSGIDPGLFQNIGWMYGLFGAVFLVLCVRFEAARLKMTAFSLKVLGTMCICIIMMHAVGFGLKALEGKRAAATSVEAVGEVKETVSVDTLAQFRKQIADIDADLEKAVAPINSEIAKLDDDGRADNDKRSDDLRARRIKLQDDAADAKKKINDQITAEIAAGGTQKATNADSTGKAEKWAPLFVGLAQLFTWSKEPSDWHIYIAGVGFNIVWMFFAHLVVIVMPPALYKLHLADARKRQAQESGSKGGRRTARKLFIEDLRKVRDQTRADLSEDRDNGNRNTPPKAAE